MEYNNNTGQSIFCLKVAHEAFDCKYKLLIYFNFFSVCCKFYEEKLILKNILNQPKLNYSRRLDFRKFDEICKSNWISL